MKTTGTDLLRTRLQRLAIAAGFLVLTGLGLAVAKTELRAYFSQQGGSAAARLLRQTELLSPGFSYYDTDAAISSCFSGLDALANPIYSDKARRQGAGHCAAMARHILRTTPTHAAARQLLAEAELLLGNPEAAADTLQEAAQLAPNTLWLVQRRFVLLLRLDPALRRIDQNGLLTRLIAVPQSRDWLAQIFVSDPAARQLIEASADALPAGDAQDFLRAIRTKARNAGANGS
ncbi:MAG: hypothetical protein R3D78_05090 [Paracoccaceae bacterium]